MTGSGKHGAYSGAPGGKRREKPFRVSVDGDRAVVVGELHGVPEGDIRLDLEARTLVISLKGSGFRRKVSLPWEARLGNKRFRKGILEITLERLGA
ncbi:MAG TPA: Hsp20/alpha crystallin family protein [Methanomicrobiales archaeon]|nr:Hsp20/alpha crystallin family protein [Methanomicrobiales archaeon]